MTETHFYSLEGKIACGAAPDSKASDDTAEVTCGKCINGDAWTYEVCHDDAARVSPLQLTNALSAETGAPFVFAAASVGAASTEHGYGTPADYDAGDAMDVLREALDHLRTTRRTAGW